ncbi:MAG: AFG1 family ATPase [Burkholderiales bacterium]|nr:AFG1 family ATPase [Burkholderiales bacterium]
MHDGALEDEHREPLPPLGGSVFDATEYTEPARHLPVTVAGYYREALARRGFAADDSQYAAVQRLQRLYEQWVAYKARRSSALRRLVVKPPLPRGVYLWGGVGRGKSFLMDSFYLTVPLVRKRRVHFHHFMRDVHREMENLKGREDPLDAVALRIARRYRLICFDEFHVNDIADAMILGRLLERTLAYGVVYCMTSNYHPDHLYRHGLKRDRFLPTIALLKERLDVVHVEGGVDYRRRAMEQVEIYHAPLGPGAEGALARAFAQIKDVEEEHHELDVEGRVIPYVKRAGGVVWFDFQALCGGPRSQLDYLDLAKRFHTVILSNVPRLSRADADQARRFTLLVDVFYEAKVKLVISAEAPEDELYTEGVLAHEFRRTASRLAEMRSKEYLAQSRRPEAATGAGGAAFGTGDDSGAAG